MLVHGINMPSFAPDAQEGDLVADPQIPNLPARSPPMTGGVGKSHGTHGSSKMIRGHVDGLKAQLQGGRGRKAEIGTATGGPSSNSSPSLGLMAPTTSLSGAKIGVGRVGATNNHIHGLSATSGSPINEATSGPEAL